MVQRRTFTAEEDSTLLAIAKEAKDEGVPLATAFIKAADELGRPVKSVTNRYSRLRKAMGGGQDGLVRSLSETEQLTIKLKALAKEMGRRDEKQDIWRTKYMELQHDYNEAQSALRKLTAEHNNLINVVKDLLGENKEPDDDGQGEMDL